jgi:predicted Zn-dependent protease
MNIGLRAAEGWIELENFTEAAEELNNLPPALKSSVEFCRLWIEINVATKAWSNAEVMCETLLKHAPDDHFAIRQQAEAFHQQGRTREAYSAYQYAPAEFKHGADYFYTLARYLCALDQGRFNHRG